MSKRIERILKRITKDHILQAIKKIDAGDPHRFGKSTKYDVLYKDKRYAPKAVVGVAAGVLTGNELEPKDLYGGYGGNKCNSVLEKKGFTVVSKGDTGPYPDEVDEEHIEGHRKKVMVNVYERDPAARRKCIKHYGAKCRVCGVDFSKRYGVIGKGFIHVHHLNPISNSKIGKEYVVDPVKDLCPVCPNCHAMLHKKKPPFTIQKLRKIIKK